MCSSKTLARDAFLEIPGFGRLTGDGFVNEHLVETLVWVDALAGVLPWAKRRGGTAMIGKNTKLLFDLFLPGVGYDDVLKRLVERVRELMPRGIAVDGATFEHQLFVDAHILQQNCCKLYQVLQYVCSEGRVGQHGRHVDA